ncbi:MAG: response regulator [Methanothrix sp.]|nr:response regulator [Methanothrix sp.]
MCHPSQLSILLAEDNDVNRKVALQMLKRLGYSADVASNGLEVLRALEERSYDVILMDIQMPEMDGIEAARRIRERWPSGAPMIVALTAFAMEGDRERLLLAGMDEYISKPIAIEELRAVLEGCEGQPCGCQGTERRIAEE